MINTLGYQLLGKVLVKMVSGPYKKGRRSVLSVDWIAIGDPWSGVLKQIMPYALRAVRLLFVHLCKQACKESKQKASGNAKGLICFAGRAGQCSNLLIKDLEKIKDFLEQNRILLDILDEPF